MISIFREFKVPSKYFVILNIGGMGSVKRETYSLLISDNSEFSANMVQSPLTNGFNNGSSLPLYSRLQSFGVGQSPGEKMQQVDPSEIEQQL